MSSILNKFAQLLMVVFTILAFVVLTTPTIHVSAAVDCTGLSGSDRTKCEACRGAGATGYSNGSCQDSSSGTAEEQVGTLIEDVINIFSFVVGVASVIMIIVGGFKYVTSGGDSNAISSAKNTILYAVIGLVIVAFAQVIVLFVINKSTEKSTTSSTATLMSTVS